jgi:hypothetical protein
MHLKHPSLLAGSAAAAALALVLAPASFGGQPVTQPLNPQPPSFYTCTAVGNGTICRGTRTEVIDPHPDDFLCPDGGIVYDQGTDNLDATRYYDANGNLTRRVLRDKWTDAQKSNPLTGLTAPYTQTTLTTDVLAVPGDFSSATETVTGEGNISIPGYGVVFFYTGRSVTDTDGNTVFQAGPPAWLGGARLAELCTALGA